MKKQETLDYIAQSLQSGLELREELMRCQNNLQAIVSVAEQMTAALRRGNKIMICGNGGSAADSQHIAAELVGRFEIKNRKGLPAIALTVDTSNLTAISNDFGYEHVFARQVSALGREGDVLVGLSTSGHSTNVIEAFLTARQMQIQTIALLGGNGGECKEYADYSIIIPSKSSARIQELHITIGHILCGIIDQYFKPNE